MQTSVLPSAHADLVTDAAFDYYGTRLATCGVDQRIKIWRMEEQTGAWTAEDDWKAHDAAISKLAWAHPEYGPILASSSFDRTVKIWEEVRNEPRNAAHSRWTERALLTDARGSVRAVEFAPRFFGLKLASISSDGVLRIYECLDLHSLSSWTLKEHVDISAFSIPTPVAVGTPTLTHASLDTPPSANPLSIASGLPQQLGVFKPLGKREADGGWCLSWCKDKYWGEIVAVGSGSSGVVKIIHFLEGQQGPVPLLSIGPTVPEGQTPSAVTTVSWAPACGRSYHLIATGSRDGKVRIWRVKPADGKTGDDDKWAAILAGEVEHHGASIGRVEWNVTGTVLSSAGTDGTVQLFKATYAGVWRPMGRIHTEQGDEKEEGHGDEMVED